MNAEVKNAHVQKLEYDKVDDVFQIEQDLIGGADLDKIKSTIKSKNLNYYTLNFDGKVIGFFECLIISPEAELYDIAVVKDYQRMGFGKFMLEAFENLAKQAGCETLLLEVNKINQPAISLYEKAGFVEYSERKNYYGDSDAILMKKKI